MIDIPPVLGIVTPSERVAHHADGRRVVLIEHRVIDNGRGIHADFLPRVFDRFKQAKTGSSRSQGGLGLGLAISRHLVELHRGRLEAYSEGEGRGSTFVLTLPLAPPPESAEGTSPSTHPSAANFSSAEDRTQALVAGYQMHLPEPAQSAELVAVIATLARLARSTK